MHLSQLQTIGTGCADKVRNVDQTIRETAAPASCSRVSANRLFRTTTAA